MSTPTDGHPLDKIHYREYKILLKPGKFTRPEQFEEYWKILSEIAHHCGVKVQTNDHAFHRMIREVLFYDTDAFDLYRNAFILRKRTFYKDGWPQADHELAIKFRHPDMDAAAAVDIHPRLEGESRIKFKEELLPLKDQLGGIRSLFSHNCVLVSPNVVLDQGLEDIARVFPALAQIDISPKTKIELVNNVAVEEVQVDPGSFDFGHGLEAKATVAIWRNRASETSLVGEFAFQARFHRLDEIHQKAKVLSEEFYRAVQTRAPEWVELGTTKTAMVYKLGGRTAPDHE
ncbi:MAG: hypothetical protein PHC88_08230 [Terrimicrobiaceae bacterium]|nr:hypothetical protein [Terrimicrobiaceae bacterium]